MSKGVDDAEEAEDDQEAVATISPQTYRSQVIRKALERHTDVFATAGDYVAATLDCEFRDPKYILEGAATVTVTIFERETGQRIGEATVIVPITFAPEHRRDV